LHVALLAPDPRDRGVVSALLEPQARVLRDRTERVVVHLAPRDDRDPLVEQRDELAQDPALGLAAESEEDEVVAREDRVHDLRHYRLLVPEDAGEELLACALLADEVLPHLLLDAAAAVSGGLQGTEGGGLGLDHGARILRPRRSEG